MSTKRGRVTAFLNGSVFTGRPGHPWAEVVVVRDGVVTAVGDRAHASAALADTDEVVDLGHGLLLPGFVDAHVHPVMGGLDRLHCDLEPGRSAQEYLTIVSEYARRNPDRPWIVGGGWSMELFRRGLPVKTALDTVAPDRPAFFRNRDRHSAWVNSHALRIAGVTASTPDPPGGRIERDADGEPAGCLHETAMDLVRHRIPPPTPEDVDLALRLAQEHLHSLGIVGWQDAALTGGPDGAPSLHEAYLRAQAAGWLTARVTGAHWWDRTLSRADIPDEVRRLVALRDEAVVRGGRYRAGSVKIMQDGVMETYTAALLQPYLDERGCATTNSGMSFMPPEDLTETVRSLVAAGFDLHFHALGDRAVREVLDAIEAARQALPDSAGRHHLAHLQLVDPDDIPRFRRLGVAANLQPYWACRDPQLDELTTPFLGDERGVRQYPFGDLARAGVTIAMGSDWPVSSADPMAGIHVAVNRRAPAADPDRPPLGDRQELTLAQALAAYTAGSAHLGRLGSISGVIAEGTPADLAVLSENPFDLPASEIGRTRVRRTYVGGELVHAND